MQDRRSDVDHAAEPIHRIVKRLEMVMVHQDLVQTQMTPGRRQHKILHIDTVCVDVKDRGNRVHYQARLLLHGDVIHIEMDRITGEGTDIYASVYITHNQIIGIQLTDHILLVWIPIGDVALGKSDRFDVHGPLPRERIILLLRLESIHKKLEIRHL